MKFDFFIDMLFPRRCLRCRDAVKNGVLCPLCRAGIAVHASFFCGQCKARIPTETGHETDPQTGSGRISKICHKDFPYVLGAAASYGDETMRTLIHHLKFRGVRSAAEPLAAIMAEYLLKTGIDCAGYCIIPVPLSAKRERERGFNQSELIGKILAGHLAIPNFSRGKSGGHSASLETKILVRIRHTPPQSSTENAREREMNVRGCFAAPPDSLRGKNIILIDDVTTSGATFFEAARAVKNAGAKKIIALAAAMA